MAFYENYVKLCNSVGKSPSAVAVELKLGKPSVTRWKNGAEPRDATLQKIADHFGVTVDFLKGEEQTNFYMRYCELCANKGISPSAAAIEIGIRKSNVTYWKSNRNNPSDATLQKIADYFGVTVEYLKGEETKKDPATNGEVSPEKRELLDLIDSLSDDQCGKISNIIKEAINLL